MVTIFIIVLLIMLLGGGGGYYGYSRYGGAGLGGALAWFWSSLSRSGCWVASTSPTPDPINLLGQRALSPGSGDASLLTPLVGRILRLTEGGREPINRKRPRWVVADIPLDD